MLQNATFTTFIYYLLENTQQCKLPLSNYMGPLSMEMVKQTAVQPVSIGKFALHKKNRAIKRGLGQKNRSEFATKNALCVHGTIEIALERIQRDIAANSRRQKRREFALCVSWPKESKLRTVQFIMCAVALLTTYEIL